jgi:hypothetical protein
MEIGGKIKSCASDKYWFVKDGVLLLAPKASVRVSTFHEHGFF